MLYCQILGGLLSSNVASWSESFITSIVFENNLLSRISLPALHKLKSSIISNIYSCNTPKVGDFLQNLLLNFDTDEIKHFQYKLLFGVFCGIFGYNKIPVQFFPKTKIGGVTNMVSSDYLN